MATILHRIQTLLLSTLFFVACSPPAKERQVFKIPTIINAVDSSEAKYMYRDSCAPRLGQAVGIYKLGDTVINTESVEENWLDSCYVDLFELWDKLDTLPSDGLQIFADYNTTIVNDSLYAGYPIYLVNETSNTKMVFGRINNRIMQEALDSNGRWRPIEYRPDFCAWVCGNGYFWGINIRSNEYLLVYLPKYSGNYKTKMRIRVRGFNTEYISNPFDGIMNYSQFYVRKDICMHWYMVLDRREEAINGAFGGTVPLGYDEDFSH